MSKLVILKLESGDFEQGFLAKLQIGEVEIESKLPSARQIIEDYESWRLTYQQLKLPLRKQFKRQERPETIDLNENCRNAAQTLSNSMKAWLNSSEFRYITEQFPSFEQSKEIRVLIQADNPQLWLLPWHRWDVFERYPNAEVALSSPVSRRIERRTLAQPRTKVRILAIQGDSTAQDNGTKIHPDADIKLLRDLLPKEEAEVVHLKEPNRKDFYDHLWDEQGWDIIFFAGHSSTDWYLNQAGRIFINSRDSLTISELKYALRSANALGLKLAIFNSCDGLGLARNLADLQIPNVVVMREPIPDPVAQAFVKDFLERFSGGESLYASVRQAREGLQELEQQFPCASWLPVICQNPDDEPISWRGLLTNIAGETNWEGCCRTLLTLDAFKRLKSNMLTKDKGMEIEDIYVPPSLGLVERQKLKDQEQSRLPTSEYKITRNYQQQEFFDEPLRRAKSLNSKGRRIAIIGEPGIGKTLLLQRIGDWVTWDLHKTKQVAIWVSLAGLKLGQSLEDYLLRDWLSRAKQQVRMSWATKETLRLLFTEGKVWLLLDGADEIPVGYGSPLAEVTRQIIESDWISEARVVLTCRLNVWEANKSLLQSFDVYRTLELTYRDEDDKTPDQVGEFIQRWFASAPAHGRSLRQALDQERRQRIKDLAKNPLQLSLLCRTWELQPPDKKLEERLPKTRAELYRQFVEAIYKWKAARFEVDETKFHWREPRFKLNAGKIAGLNRDLAKLAKRALERKPSSFIKMVVQAAERSQFSLADKTMLILERAGWEEQTAPFRISHSLAWSILSSDLPLALELGWLNQVGVAKHNSQEPVYAFFHPIFQEYFAAQAINFNEWEYFLSPNINFIHPAYGRYRVFESQWREVILLWFGRLSADVPDQSKENFLRALWKFRDGCEGFYSFQAQFLAAAALAEFKNCPDDLANQIVKELIDLSIPYFNSKEDFALPFDSVKERAEVALRQTDPRRATNALEQLIKRISPAYFGFRVGAAITLMAIDPGNQVAIDTFLEWLRSPEEKLDRFYLRKCLIQTARGNCKAINTLTDWLNYDQDEELRLLAARILGVIAQGTEANEIKAIQAVDVLFEKLHITSDREQIFYIYKYFEEVAIENPTVTEYVVKGLTTILKQVNVEHPESYTFFADEKRLCAAQGLLGIARGNHLAINTLVGLLRADPYNLGEIAIDKLKKCGSNNSAVIKALSEVINSLDQGELTDCADRVMWKIVDTLGEIAFGNRDAIEALSQRLEVIAAPWQCLEVANNLGRIDPDNSRALAALEELMQSAQDEFLRAAAAQYLAQLKPDDPKGVTVLIELQQMAQARLTGFISELGLNQNTVTETIHDLLSDSYRQSGDSPRTESQRRVSETEGFLGNIAGRLKKVARGNSSAIAALTQLLHNTQDESLQIQLAESLGTIDPGNPLVFNTLIHLYRMAQKEDRRSQAATKIQWLATWKTETSDGTRKQIVIDALSELVQTTQDEWERFNRAETLGKFDPSNRLAVATLVDLLKTNQRIHISNPVAGLVKTLQGDQIQPVCMEIVKSCKEYLVQTQENFAQGDNGDRFEEWLKLFWHCAEILSYPDFYRAYHNEPALFYLQPGLLLKRFKLSLFSCQFWVGYYIRHPQSLLSITFRLIGFIFRCTRFGPLILCLPLFIVFSLISHTSKRFLGFNIVVTFFNLIAYAVGGALGIGLCLLVVAIIFGIPLYLVFRLFSWIFGW